MECHRLNNSRVRRHVTQMVLSAKRRFFNRRLCLGTPGQLFVEGTWSLAFVRSRESSMEFGADDYGAYLASVLSMAIHSADQRRN